MGIAWPNNPKTGRAVINNYPLIITFFSSRTQATYKNSPDMFPKDKQKSGKAINSEDPQYDLEVRQ